MREGADRYDGVARSFHWLVVLLVVAQYATKWLPAGFASMSEGQFNTWHLAIGPTILLLMLLRLAWRLTHHTPPPPSDLSAPLQLLSRTTHWLFYALLVVLPVLVGLPLRVMAPKSPCSGWSRCRALWDRTRAWPRASAACTARWPERCWS